MSAVGVRINTGSRFIPSTHCCLSPLAKSRHLSLRCNPLRHVVCGSCLPRQTSRLRYARWPLNGVTLGRVVLHSAARSSPHRSGPSQPLPAPLRCRASPALPSRFGVQPPVLPSNRSGGVWLHIKCQANSA